MIITVDKMPKARNCHKVCVFSFGETKQMVLIHRTSKSHIEKLFLYDNDDDRLSLVVCTTFKRDVSKIKDDPERSITLPRLFLFEAFAKSYQIDHQRDFVQLSFLRTSQEAKG